MATKGIKMSEEALEVVNSRIEASGMDAGEWLESLMALEVIKEIQKHDPAVEYDLKDLEKHMNRVYHILIRIYQRGADSVEEIKLNSLEDTSNLSQELESLRVEFSHIQKRLSQKEEELIEASATQIDLRTKMDLLEKTATTLEELNRLNNDKLKELKAKIDEQLHIEQEAIKVKNELVEQRKSYEQELQMQKEEVIRIRKENEELEKDNNMKKIEHDSKIDQLMKAHERELEILKKEMEMTAKETLLKEKSLWQENSNLKIDQLTKEHMHSMTELIKKFQSNSKDIKIEGN
ncbi:hypothetical protein MHB77_31780 [Paenibacillus sp. FSL K6-3166]|uniref:hypothetical protein n=1 Tax=Paenibacillus sp. FSL K6-3166 TaxID=2921492 RepID=UPI0030F730B9